MADAKQKRPRSRRILTLLLVLCAAFLASFATSCSPLYVMEAGVEEAKILWRREPIDELIESDSTDDTTRTKLRLVRDAREYAASIGLKPEGSFTKYSKIDRDVLLWVLSGSSKIALAPVTWWFPIVGRIPYKGFFDKEDADSEAAKLAKRDFDVYLRPSAAFSTLGWFDDPLLSTTLRYDELSLANTVVHEILHNTIWIPDHAPFNETLANFVGSMGAVDFYTKREGAEGPHVIDAKKRWSVDVDFAHFLEDTVKELEPIYKAVGSAPPKAGDPAYAEVVAKRDKVLEDALARWETKYPVGEKARKKGALNNATIIAFQIYLTKPWLFEELFELTGGTLPAFIVEMKRVEKLVKDEKKDPYEVLARVIAERKNSSTDGKNPVE